MPCGLVYIRLPFNLFWYTSSRFNFRNVTMDEIRISYKGFIIIKADNSKWNISSPFPDCNKSMTLSWTLCGLNIIMGGNWSYRKTEDYRHWIVITSLVPTVGLVWGWLTRASRSFTIHYRYLHMKFDAVILHVLIPNQLYTPLPPSNQ